MQSAGSREQRVLAQPKLPWFPLEEAFEDGEPNLFSLLRWNFRLVENLYGRDDELNKILKWARSPSRSPSARLITGPGGFGKTRLVATATDILKGEGWSAGFLDSASDLEATNVGLEGFFLAVDYPEEQPERTTALLKKLSELTTAPYRIRVVFVSRRPFAEWEPQAAMLQGRFGRQELAALAPLSVPQCISLAQEAVYNLRKYMEVGTLNLRVAENWFSSAASNRIPLYATAAVVHALVSPAEAFGIGGAELLNQLALRERQRVRKISEAIGFGSEGLERLLALAVVADGLNEQTVSELISKGVCRKQPNSDAVFAVAQTPWWKAGRLIRLEPDLLAAAFFDQVLFGSAFPSGRSELPDWLFVTLRERAETLVGRLERLFYDLDSTRSQQGAHPLEDCLNRMIANEPSRAATFAAVAETDVPFWAAGFAAVIGSELANAAEDPQVKATYLSHTSVHLSRIGRNDDSLRFAEEAVELRRLMTPSHSAVAKRRLVWSLVPYVNALSRVKRFQEAVAPAMEAVALCRTLSEIDSEAFAPLLAGTLNSLVSILSHTEQDQASLDAAQEAVLIQRTLAARDPQNYTTDLATCVSNLSNQLSKLGRHHEALDAAQQAVDINRALAGERPAAFTPVLAASLNNLSGELAEVGRLEDAIAAAREAVSIQRGLARVKAEAFLPLLGNSLMTLSIALFRAGHADEAITSAKEGVSIFRALVGSWGDIFVEQLAASLLHLRDYSSSAGKVKEAAGAQGELEMLVQRFNLSG
ncbi:MAG: hypothetical protein QOF41_2198 [Methylobacteriaceae bacterium]|nr:hypothetical protein [Methylobacteriaceae bacterium]